MELLTTSDTTTLSYWLNWRVLLCAICVLAPTVVAVYILRKYESLDLSRSCRGKSRLEIVHSLYDDEPWRPCLQQIHPLCLLAYRVIAFCWLLATLIIKVSLSGFGMFYYYTQWTFTFVTIYFGFGSLLSVYGYYQCHKMGSTRSNVTDVWRDAEDGQHVPLMSGEITNGLDMRKFSNNLEEIRISQAACISSFLFQVIFQMTAGAVMLTDCVYWSIIFPFLTIKDYALNFMTVNMHTLNAVLLLGDAALNSLPFPWFRISYFILWTGGFVIFQWIFHACVSFWWPYPFLDLSSLYAPLWYLLIALMHIPCYGFFVLIIKIKCDLLSKWFPLSYQCLREEHSVCLSR